jgi:hypothetical protein
MTTLLRSARTAERRRGEGARDRSGRAPPRPLTPGAGCVRARRHRGECRWTAVGSRADGAETRTKVSELCRSNRPARCRARIAPAISCAS